MHLEMSGMCGKRFQSCGNDSARYFIDVHNNGKTITPIYFNVGIFHTISCHKQVRGFVIGYRLNT